VDPAFTDAYYRAGTDMVRMLKDWRISVWNLENELNPQFAESLAPYSENFHFSAAYVVTVST
jgi:hypothetical protein